MSSSVCLYPSVHNTTCVCGLDDPKPNPACCGKCGTKLTTSNGIDFWCGTCRAWNPARQSARQQAAAAPVCDCPSQIAHLVTCGLAPPQPARPMPQQALTDVAAERVRQEQLRHDGRFPYTCAGDGLTPAEKLAVLAEEFGEVAREISDARNCRTEPNPKRLRAELVQVAAVAVAWVESLDAAAARASAPERACCTNCQLPQGKCVCCAA
jgi:NTP pyrophosphatase (non-canonical NTP hydrolase)